MESFWAVQAELLPSIAEAIRTSLDINARDGLQPREGVASHTGGGVAILRLGAFLSQRPTFLSLLLGGTSIDEFSQRLRSAVADPGVSTIILDTDSPGGGVHGVQELADEIYEARKHKRIIAAVNSMAASAAYWAISGAHEINVTPSGELGSIGIFGVHHDLSRANEKAGVKPTYVSAGRYKVETVPVHAAASR
jgi:ClpP class serine protease